MASTPAPAFKRHKRTLLVAYAVVCLVGIGWGLRRRHLNDLLCASLKPGDAEEVQALLQQGANPNATCAWGGKPLGQAAVYFANSHASSNRDAADILLCLARAGAKVEPDILDYVLEGCGARRMDCRELRGEMEARGARLSAKSLGAAIQFGDLALARQVLDMGADVNGHVNTTQGTPLTTVAAYEEYSIPENDAIQIGEWLIYRGADLNKVSSKDSLRNWVNWVHAYRYQVAAQAASFPDVYGFVGVGVRRPAHRLCLRV